MLLVVGNLFQSDTAPIGPEHLQVLLQTATLRIERIASHGQPSPDGFWYDQPNEEWVIVLKGFATLSFADEENIDLKAGDYLLIPAHLRHRVKCTSDDALWLVAHFK